MIWIALTNATLVETLRLVFKRLMTGMSNHFWFRLSQKSLGACCHTNWITMELRGWGSR